jgi:hypothetical protein
MQPMPLTLLLLSQRDVQQAVSMPEAIEMMRLAFGQLAAGEAVMPMRISISVDRYGGTAHFMPPSSKQRRPGKPSSFRAPGTRSADHSAGMSDAETDINRHHERLPDGAGTVLPPVATDRRRPGERVVCSAPTSGATRSVAAVRGLTRSG